MELCAASLDQLFLKSGDPRKYKGPALPNHLEVFYQLALGLEYIHSKDLVYRDIKPSNVLIFIVPSINHRPIIRVTMKWADFGLSKFVNERGTCRTSEIKGTANYFAPELLKKTENQKELGRGTMKSDVFSFALVIGYLLLKGQHVYGFNYFCIYGNIWNKNLFKINSKSYNLKKYSEKTKNKTLFLYRNWSLAFRS
jgi:serine/threonine protein kinase